MHFSPFSSPFTHHQHQKSPQYMRHRRLSNASSTPRDDGAADGGHNRSEQMFLHRWSNGDDGAELDRTSLKKAEKEGNLLKNEEEALRLVGVRRYELIGLFCWLAALAGLAMLLFVLHLCLISILQISPHGMRALRFYSYENIHTGNEEQAVHFSANDVHLGKVVVASGKVLGNRDKEVDIRASRILIGVGESAGLDNGTRLLLQEGNCRLEETNQFQIRQPNSGKVLFNARHPPVGIDKRIRRIAASHIVTNKLRAPVDEELRIAAEDVSLRGNERIKMEAKRVNGSANRINIKTTDDGSIWFSGRIFVGSKWRTLPISSSPALTASVDAFRVCVCQQRPKLFIVPGNRPCGAHSTICQ